MNKKYIPAIPPSDYQGTVAAWMVGLQMRGFWDGNGWHGDVEIPADDWWALLEECEGVLDGDCSVKCNDTKHHKTCKSSAKKEQTK